MSFIFSNKIDYEYSSLEENTKIKALKEIEISIKEGEFICILGHNGCGKSTLAKHMNALIKPTRNDVFVKNLNTKDNKNTWEIRKIVGMVFQNPDNQIISTIVEDDIAFGLENLGVNPKEIKERINKVLDYLGILEYKNFEPSNLSGGQKQKVAIAGVLAMNPRCIVFDEATSMLDPLTRDEVIKVILKLNKEQNMTIIFITHHLEETINADRLIIMKDGEIVLQDKPENVFLQYEKLKDLNLDLPDVTKLSYELNKKGYNIKKNCLHIKEFCDEIKKVGFKKEIKLLEYKNNEDDFQEGIIEIKNLSYSYPRLDGDNKKVLDNINLSVKKGEILGIIGHTGSGKSTLIQHINAIIKPKDKTIFFKGKDILSKEVSLKDLRSKIGLVFQYPESQLFEETVFKDVSFAPKNMNLPEDEIKERVVKALDFVKIDKSFYDRSPFELSGGQKRRVAIAGILAMQPEVIIFDEPTAGLDPKTKDFILNNIKRINREQNTTIIIVSHSMEDICKFTDRVLVMNKGKIELIGKTKDVFKEREKLESCKLKVPSFTEIFYNLNNFNKKIPLNIINLKDSIDFFAQNLEK